MRLGLGLHLTASQGGEPAPYVVTLTGLTSGEARQGATIGVSIEPAITTETVSYQWQANSTNISGATTATEVVEIGTTHTDAETLRLIATIDGVEFASNGAPMRYAPGSVTESALADWTIDDDTLNVNLASDFTTTNLTGSYVITGLPSGAVDDGDGTISGTPDGTPETASITATFTDQYGRQIVGTYSVDTVYRTQATGGTDLDLSFPEDSAISSTDLVQNWTANGNTLSFVSVSPSLPAGLSISSAGALTGTPTTVTADATYTLTMEDEYGRETTDTFTLEITAAAGTITIDSLTYTRGTAGVAPDLATTVSSTPTVTGNFTLFWATRSIGTALSKSAIENGTGDALDNGSITAANLADLDGTLDLANSLSSGAIDAFVRDSTSGTPVESDVVSETGVTYDAVAPAFSSAVVENATPSTLTITLDKDAYVAAGETLEAADFTLGGTYGGSISTATRTNATTYTLGLSTAVVNGDTLTIALGSGTLVGIDAEAVSFTENVENNVGTSFSDDFSTDTSASYTKWDGDETLAVSGGVATVAGTTGNQLVMVSRDVSLAGDHEVILTLGSTPTTNDRAVVNGGFVDANNWVAAEYYHNVGSPTMELKDRTSGTVAVLTSTSSMASLSAGDKIRLTVDATAGTASAHYSTDGGSTWLLPNSDAAFSGATLNVTPGTRMGFRAGRGDGNGAVTVDQVEANDT